MLDLMEARQEHKYRSWRLRNPLLLRLLTLVFLQVIKLLQEDSAHLHRAFREGGFPEIEVSVVKDGARVPLPHQFLHVVPVVHLNNLG